MIMIGRGAAGVGAPDIDDSERRHAGQISYGIVRQARYTNPPAVRVAIGDESDTEGHLLTDWLPMGGLRACGDTEWHPLEVGEAVIVLSPSGEVQNGMVIPAGFFTSDNPAPAATAGLWLKSFKDGGTVSYDRNTGAFLVDAKTSATLKVGGNTVAVTSSSITLTVGGVSLVISSSGFAFTGGTVTHGGKDIGSTHKHGLVKAGTDQSGTPV